MTPKLRTITNQPSWLIANKDVEPAVTRLGGQWRR